MDPANIPELAWLWNEGEPNRFRVPLGEEAFGAEKNPALPSVKKTIVYVYSEKQVINNFL